MMPHERRSFWREAFAVKESIGPRVFVRSLVFGAIALVLSVANALTEPDLGVDIVPLGIAGSVLGLLLVFRSNAGYDRWWEGRKLWGGITNASRGLAIGALAYGPADRTWRGRFVRRIIAFAHATRASLRGHKEVPELAKLLGADEARQIETAEHMPTYIALTLARQLNDACVRFGMDRFAYQELDHHLSLLIDHLGGCERIARTHLPKIQILLIRQWVVLFLLVLPLGLMQQFRWLWPQRYPFDWLTPLVTILVAYPILCIDQVGFELQDPFSADRLSHLPLPQITARIETDLLALMAADLSTSESGIREHPNDRVGVDPCGNAVLSEKDDGMSLGPSTDGLDANDQLPSRKEHREQQVDVGEKGSSPARE
jgi:putative membrane protein